MNCLKELTKRDTMPNFMKALLLHSLIVCIFCLSHMDAYSQTTGERPSAILENDSAQMVRIPAGSFLMGSTVKDAENDKDSCQNRFLEIVDRSRNVLGDDWAREYLEEALEKCKGISSRNLPQHAVYLDEFLIDAHEVTTAQYTKFLFATGTNYPEHWHQLILPQDGDLPIVGMKWEEARAYCQWVGKRLPTEAEWEKAARGDDGRLFPWGNEIATPDHANFGKELGSEFREHIYNGSVTPVGNYPLGKSPYGVFDMAGNASEWVADWYDESYYQRSPKRNPQGPETGKLKVYRGASFRSTAKGLRSDWRFSNDGSPPAIGFRCAKDAR